MATSKNAAELNCGGSVKPKRKVARSGEADLRTPEPIVSAAYGHPVQPMGAAGKAFASRERLLR